MFRLMYLTFWSPKRMSHEAEHHVHESPKSMTVPLIVLATCSIFAGFLGVPHALGGSNRFEKFLEPVFVSEAHQVTAETAQLAPVEEQKEEPTQPIEYVLMLASVAAAGVGLGLAYKAYKNAGKGYTEPINAFAPPLYTTLLNKYYVDELYDYLFTGRRKIGPVRLGVMGAGDALWKFDANVIDGTVNGAGWVTRTIGTISSWWDKWIIDGVCVNGPAIVAQALSYPARLIQWGLVQWYALVMVGGILGFGAYYFVPSEVWHWIVRRWYVPPMCIIVLAILALLVFRVRSQRRLAVSKA
jgi:NADH-quinone oxidoreductase subunit L